MAGPRAQAHVQGHPGQWSRKRSHQTAEDLGLPALAFILQQILKWEGFLLRCSAGRQLGKNGSQDDQFSGRRRRWGRVWAGEAVVVERKASRRMPGKEGRQGRATNGRWVGVEGWMG